MRKMDSRLKNFDNCVSALQSGNFIFMSKGISELLKTVVDSEFLSSVITQTRQNFSYEDEFRRARVILPEKDGEIRSKLILPEGDERRFTFITYLLSEMDLGKRDPFKFISEYFPARDKQESYNLFCKELISEYSVCAHNIAKVVYNEAYDLRKDFFASDIKLSDEDKQELCAFFGGFSKIKLKGSPDAKKDFRLLLDAVIASSESGNARLVALFATSLKFALTELKAPQSVVKDMLKLLENKRII